MSIPAFTLVQGLVIGLGYGLLAMGLVLMYRTSRVLNFAHGQLGVVSAVLLSKLVREDHTPYTVALPLVLVLAAVIGAISELLLRRLFNRPRVLVMVATIGLAQVLYLLTLLPFVRPKKLFGAYPVPFHASFGVGAYKFLSGDVLTLLVAPVIAVVLGAFFARSRLGLNMRAIAENSESARLSGIWVRRTSMVAWMLAGVLSAVTAILASPDKATGFSQALGPDLLLRALAAALVGGMVSLTIAFIAGIGIGIFQQVVAWNWTLGSNIETAMFVLLLAVLFASARRLRHGPRDEERSSWRFSGEARAGPASPARVMIGRAATAVLLLIALVFPLLASHSRTFLVSRIYVFSLIALSLTVLTGWAGQLSLGNFGLVAVGAIVASRLGLHHPFPLVLAVAALLGAAVAVIIGLPALRIRGLYLAVTTLGFALFMNVAVVATPCWRVPGPGWRVCTGLPNPASTLLRRPSLFGISLRSERAMDYVVLGVLILTVLIVRTWRDRGIARDLIAVRDNEVGASAVGVHLVTQKLLAFALSGGIAGVAGVCFAYVTERFSALSFDPSISILVVAMVIIGGLGSIEGALLGAAYLIGIPAAFGSGPTVQFITSGIGLLVFLLYVPGGLAGVLSRIGDALAGLLTPATTADGPAAPARTMTTAAPSPRPGAALTVRDVSVAFGGVFAVQGVTFSVAPGEIVGIIGPNGSGKTTLLDAITGLVPLEGGGVSLDGQDLTDYLTADRAALGITRSFQDCRLFPELTVEQTLLVAEDGRQRVGLVPTTLHLPPARRAERAKRAMVDETLAGFGLERFRHRLISELSTGTRRIVDLAAILAAQPRLLLLDEPTSGVAQREAEAFGPLVRRLHALTGATILIVEHDVPLTLSLCDRLIVMESGKEVSSGTPNEVVADPIAIAAYLGASAEAVDRSGAIRGTDNGKGRAPNAGAASRSRTQGAVS